MRAPSACRGTPSSRAAADRAVRSSHDGSRQPASRRGSSTRAAPSPGESRRRSSAVARDPALGEVLELEAVQAARAVVLVLEQVREVGDRDPLRAGAVAPDAQRRLLRHDPAREERGRGLSEELGDLRLEPGDRAALGVDVPLGDVHRLGLVGDHPQHLARCPGWVPEDGGVAGPRGSAEALHQLVVAHVLTQAAGCAGGQTPSGWGQPGLRQTETWLSLSLVNGLPDQSAVRRRAPSRRAAPSGRTRRARCSGSCWRRR